MSDDGLKLIVLKNRRLKELHRAQQRVRQIEKELRGEGALPEELLRVPAFLRARNAPSD